MKTIFLVLFLVFGMSLAFAGHTDWGSSCDDNSFQCHPDVVKTESQSTCTIVDIGEGTSIQKCTTLNNTVETDDTNEDN